MKKDFDVIYTEICEHGGNKFFEEYKKKTKKVLQILIIIIIASIVLYKFFGIVAAGFSIIIGCLIILFSLFKIQEKYIDDYRKIIVAKLVSLYNPKLQYDYKLGFKEIDYINSKLPEKFDVFKSSNSIFGKIVEEIDFKMSYINTYRKEKAVVDGEVQTENIEIFKGIFGCGRISKSVNSEIIIDLNDFKKRYKLNRIELESVDFEKSFDCFSNNKIVALQILTPDVVEQINQLCDKFKNSLQLRINNDMIFFRFSLNELFAPPKFTNPLDRERIKKLYDVIYFSTNIVECIFDSIDENI